MNEARMIEAMRQEQRKRRLKIKTEGDAGPGGGMARPPTASPKNAAARRSPSNRRRGPAAQARWRPAESFN